MAYTKKTWEDFPNTSTPITADDLNNIEDGIEALDTGKANLASPTFTGTVTLPSSTSIGNVSSTELGYLDGVSGGIQGQLDNKMGAWVSLDLFPAATGGAVATKLGGTNVSLTQFKLLRLKFVAQANPSHRQYVITAFDSANNYLMTQYGNVIHFITISGVVSGSGNLIITPASGSNLIQMSGIDVII